MVDSKEMLYLLPDEDHITNISGAFPDETSDLLANYKGYFNLINSYSVLPVIFGYSCIFKFIDSTVSLLKSGGRLLLVDIGNISMRKRFFL